jgi:hypothetical protein
MMKSSAMAATAIFGLFVSGVDGFAARKFRKLGGSQIQVAQKDELCVDVGPGTDSGCFEVWISGKAAELRPTRLGVQVKGVLQKPNSSD